jgi:hypothetical protein
MAFPAASGAPPAPLPVVGHQFCAPYVVPLTVTKKALSLSDGDFAITDANGAVVLKVKGTIFSMRHRRVLLDAAGQPLLSMQEKVSCLFASLCFIIFTATLEFPRSISNSEDETKPKMLVCYQIVCSFSVYSNM